MEFLQVVESLKAEEASVSRLFSKEGRGARHSAKGPDYQRQLVEAAEFMADIYSGKRRFHQFQEAMTTSDFPLLFGDVLDRQLLSIYNESTPTYRNWCHIATVSDFRTVHRFAVDGSEATLAEVKQQAEYPESKLSDTQYAYAVKKYGRSTPFAWEAMQNDDLDALKDIPRRYGRAARRSEELFATQLLCDANGPHATFFTDAHKNVVDMANGAGSDDPPLSISALQDAMTVLSNQRDADGEPIIIDTVELVVPPALEVLAMNILNATELRINPGGAVGTTLTDTSQNLVTLNWMKNRMRLNVNHYIPRVVSSGNIANTCWFLIANPDTTRPCFEVGFLRGHEQPEIFMKEPNSVRIGGSSNPMDGDFDTDSIRYKIRHVFGGTQLDVKGAVASAGDGS